MHAAKWKKVISKSMYCIMPTIWYLGKGKAIVVEKAKKNSKKISYQGLGTKSYEKKSTGNCRVVKLFCTINDTIHLSKPVEWYSIEITNV